MENMNSTNLSTVRASLVIAVALARFVVQPDASAVMPPPDGGYPGFNTAEGENALLSLTSGTYNTAIGFLSLQDVTTGARNTAVGAATLVLNNGVNNRAIGAGALLNNAAGNNNTATGFFRLDYKHGRQFQHGERSECSRVQHYRRREHGHRC